MDDNKS
jgi:hypothetical protein